MERNTAKKFTPEQIAHYTETRIDDTQKAEHMAREGEAQAGYTAEIREAIHIVDIFRRGIITYKQLKQLGKGHPGFTINIQEPEEIVSSFHSGTLRRVMRGEFEEDLTLKRRAAEIEQACADGIMDWAGILYDHPISDEYREAHPEIQFKTHRIQNPVIHEPLEFWLLSSKIEKDFEIIKSREEGLESIEGSEIFDEKECVNGWTVDSILKEFGQEEDRETWEGLKKNPHTTNADMKKFYADLFRGVFLEPWKKELTKLVSILEDVKSGRASQGEEDQQASSHIAPVVQ